MYKKILISPISRGNKPQKEGGGRSLQGISPPPVKEGERAASFDLSPTLPLHHRLSKVSGSFLFLFEWSELSFLRWCRLINSNGHLGGKGVWEEGRLGSVLGVLEVSFQ
ncbi:hypothetical protein CEXT_433591 [Caerostris extrusa]|uniref:Uncharacterized protein n=1 Tax=Caerostris extrusa TaxID=172846 RepID=A0AAV4TJ09_CAEEX|nr:hypothetical protein CEXT_433591 [Caerostris extrusa]